MPTASPKPSSFVAKSESNLGLANRTEAQNLIFLLQKDPNPILVPKHRRPLHDIVDRLPREHLFAPVLNRRPAFYINPQELEHPRHGEREVGEIGQRGAVFERDIILVGEGEALFEDVPLLDGVLVQPMMEVSWNTRISIH